MSNLNSATRLRVAALANELYARQIDYPTFLSRLPEVDLDQEDAVTELLDLIVHEPVRGRFMGLPPEEHAAYMADVQRRIAELVADIPESDRAI